MFVSPSLAVLCRVLSLVMKFQQFKHVYKRVFILKNKNVIQVYNN